MTVQTITDDGCISWYCPGSKYKKCGRLLSTSLDEVVYQDCPMIDEPGEGAVMVLPTCPCGIRTDLKADYTLEELYEVLIRYEENGMCAYLLPLRYVHNLHVHFLLYQRGKAAYAPVLEMPPQALLEHPSFASIKPSTVYALWFGFATMKQYAPQEIEPYNVFLIGA